MILAVPDLISPSYFPAIAAVELGLAREEGVSLELELRFPVTDAADDLRKGRLDFLAGAAHVALGPTGRGPGLTLLAALSQRTYWFLVLRPGLSPKRSLGDLRNLRIGAAPGPDLALEQMFRDSEIDVRSAGIEIGPVPSDDVKGISFGVAAAKALEDGLIDGFWANGMGAEVAVRSGTGEIVVDARRERAVHDVARYTFPALMVSPTTRSTPGELGAVTRALVRAQSILRTDPAVATEVGNRLFPPMEAGLIAELVRRDAPFYDPAIPPDVVTDLMSFALRSGWSDTRRTYSDIVRSDMQSIWKQASE